MQKIFIMTCLLLQTFLVAIAGDPNPKLLDPKAAVETAPDTYRIQFKTTKGTFTVKVTRDWSPNGADRLYNLVKIGFYKDIAFFRVINGFMSQFGLHGDPAVTKAWRMARIKDDPRKDGVSNQPGYLTFATSGPNSRTTQLFINTRDNTNLDYQGFTPMGVVEGDGMGVVLSLYNEYGEGMPRGRGPDQRELTKSGNEYLKKYFSRLDYIIEASLVE